MTAPLSSAVSATAAAAVRPFLDLAAELEAHGKRRMAKSREPGNERAKQDRSAALARLADVDMLRSTVAAVLASDPDEDDPSFPCIACKHPAGRHDVDGECWVGRCKCGTGEPGDPMDTAPDWRSAAHPEPREDVVERMARAMWVAQGKHPDDWGSSELTSFRKAQDELRRLAGAALDAQEGTA